MASRALQRALAAPAPCAARLFGGRVRRYTDGVPGRGAIRRRRVCAASGEGFGRRGAFAASLSAAAVAATACPAVADEDYNVRLKDVEDARTRAAVEAAARGDEALAEQLFRQVTETDPGLASAWSNLGNIQNSMGKFADAERNLSKAVELAPGAPVPLLNRAVSRQALGRLTEARDDCSAAIELDGNEFAAWHNRGQIEADMGEWERALADYTVAADLAPGLAGYRLKQGLAAWQTGDDALSRQLLAGLARKYAQYAEAHAALCAVLWALDEGSQAEEQFAYAKRLDSRWSSAEHAVEMLWPPRAVAALDAFLRVERFVDEA